MADKKAQNTKEWNKKTREVLMKGNHKALDKNHSAIPSSGWKWLSALWWVKETEMLMLGDHKIKCALIFFFPGVTGPLLLLAFLPINPTHRG